MEVSGSAFNSPTLLGKQDGQGATSGVSRSQPAWCSKLRPFAWKKLFRLSSGTANQVPLATTTTTQYVKYYSEGEPTETVKTLDPKLPSLIFGEFSIVEEFSYFHWLGLQKTTTPQGGLGRGECGQHPCPQENRRECGKGLCNMNLM
ncbi:hypothetical protein TNCV_2588271 [Trichonephila clavipes]|nr:hypothetical protein TNCV_2588271 [Trichonephila clavipes]